MEKVVIAFLRKESDMSGGLKSIGNKLICNGILLGQWKEHSFLINDTNYEQKFVKAAQDTLYSWAKRSDIIYRICSKPVPEDARDLKRYE